MEASSGSLFISQYERGDVGMRCACGVDSEEEGGVRREPRAAFLNPGGVQVGEVIPASGSSDARRSHQPDYVPSPCSSSIGSRKYRTLANRRTSPFYACAGARAKQ